MLTSAARATMLRMTTIQSPCTLVCRMNPRTGLCVGCCRTLEEIAGWSGYSDEQRAAIMESLSARRELHKADSPDQRTEIDDE